MKKLQRNQELQKSLSISFKLNSVNILSFTVRNDQNIKKDYEFVFGIGVKQNVNTIKNTIEVIVSVKVYTDKSKKSEIGDIETSNIFEVKDMKTHLRKEENIIRFPEVMLASIIGISISNTRGILVAKSAGTAMAKAIIPIINPTEMLRNSHTKEKKGK